MATRHHIFKDVPRETIEKLEIYEQLLTKWQQRINLVSPTTIPHLWTRHFADSIQLTGHIAKHVDVIVDVGSGAGFPGIILAIATNKTIHLVESDQRKCAFMREVLRATGTHANIHNQRIETFDCPEVDLITSRACASLTKLLNMLCPLLEKKPICLFQKGENYIKELEELVDWSYNETIHPSQIHSASVIIELTEIARIHHGKNHSSC